MRIDLTKIEDRKAYVAKLEKDLAEEIIRICSKDKIHPSIRLRIGEHSIEMYSCIEDKDKDGYDFGSEITIYNSTNRGVYEINYGTTGSYDPLEVNSIPVWRANHVYSLVNNWDKLIPVFERFFEMYNVLSFIPVIKEEEEE